MSKKLQQNGLFESSRMMLPEHREAYILHQEQLAPRTRPSLDSQAAEEMSRLLSDSMVLGDIITITLFHEYDDIRITGQVLRMNRPARTLKLLTDNGTRDIQMNLITDVTLASD
ncbi:MULTISPECIES: YolD-like family protein [Paenibacillus]|uniref:YolD-like family protein n=1 Tax=Paenibacillus TaxID=44249 RepID=UPI000FE225AF|nr:MULTISPECIES: YolD-like family protein [Paenibacillus]MCM3171263.1 YolD-like family protein [Paenibacillus sp. MER 99-2]